MILQQGTPIQTEPAKLPGAKLFGFDTGVSGTILIPLFIVFWALLTFALYKILKAAIRKPFLIPDRLKMILEPVRTPLVMLFGLIGLKIVSDSNFFPTETQAYLNFIVGLALTIILVIGMTRLVTRAIDVYARQYELLEAVSGTLKFISQVLIAAIGILIWMQSNRIEISAILTTLGLVSVAAAIALQDTLTNLISGIHIILDRGVREGDYIKLDTGEEGYVSTIGWRNTKLQTLRNNMVLIPNKKLTGSVVTNFHLPQKAISVTVSVTVAYDADPQAVETALHGVAQSAARDLPAMVNDPPPVVRFIPGFTETGMSFSVICYVREFADQFLIQHELRKRIVGRFRQEGIPFAQPPRPGSPQ